MIRRPPGSIRTATRLADSTLCRSGRGVMGVDLGEFPRIAHAVAMRRYGSDKPDLRFDMELVDVAELVQGCEFKVLTDWASADDGRVVPIGAPGAASRSRKTIDEPAEHAAKDGAKGLAGKEVAEPGRGSDSTATRRCTATQSDHIAA